LSQVKSCAVKRLGKVESFQFPLESSSASFVSDVGGRAFHADGPENENALSPNFVRRRGMSNRPLSLDRKPCRSRL